MPVAGKDGKTGQTFIKTVLAPAFRSRSLYVEGWFSTNILGNRDGLALDNPDSLKSKLNTKGSVLDDILGYPVEDHIVDIRYYQAAGRQQGGVGQHRPGGVPGPEDAGQGELPLPGQHPGGAAR